MKFKVGYFNACGNPFTNPSIAISIVDAYAHNCLIVPIYFSFTGIKGGDSGTTYSYNPCYPFNTTGGCINATVWVVNGTST